MQMLKTQSLARTLARMTVTLALMTSTLARMAVTLARMTVTLARMTVTLARMTVTLARMTVTLAMMTVTLAMMTVTLAMMTVTLALMTSTLVLMTSTLVLMMSILALMTSSLVFIVRTNIYIVIMLLDGRDLYRIYVVHLQYENYLMKKRFLLIPFLFLFGFYSCNKCRVCSEALTDEEKSFICYKGTGHTALSYFKNNISGAIDSLVIDPTQGGSGLTNCNDSEGCQAQESFYRETFTTHFGSWEIAVYHNIPPFFNLNISMDMPTQTFTVNNIEYNDIFSIVTATNNNQHCWKLYYSRSKGFVCFFMEDGSYWYKL